MPKPGFIELPDCDPIPILHEDRAALAIDKPAGWMLVPVSWQRTSRNLQAALLSSIAARNFWARSRNLRFLRFVHRLDTETTGVLLFGKSQGAVRSLGELFENRRMEKLYLAVVTGTPKQTQWVCREKIGPAGQSAGSRGRRKIDPKHGKPAETEFRVLESRNGCSLLEARPFTGRTHQIRLHLAHMGLPVVGDPLYGSAASPRGLPLGLRSVRLAYLDPFTRKPVEIRAPMDEFVREHGFEARL